MLEKRVEIVSGCYFGMLVDNQLKYQRFIAVLIDVIIKFIYIIVIKFTIAAYKKLISLPFFIIEI